LPHRCPVAVGVPVAVTLVLGLRKIHVVPSEACADERVCRVAGGLTGGQILEYAQKLDVGRVHKSFHIVLVEKDGSIRIRVNYHTQEHTHY
jgi:hypothetical protein